MQRIPAEPRLLCELLSVAVLSLCGFRTSVLPLPHLHFTAVVHHNPSPQCTHTLIQDSTFSFSKYGPEATSGQECFHRCDSNAGCVMKPSVLPNFPGVGELMCPAQALLLITYAVTSPIWSKLCLAATLPPQGQTGCNRALCQRLKTAHAGS